MAAVRLPVLFICGGRVAAYLFDVLIAERFFSAVPHGHLLGVCNQDFLFS
jgi:hypothetical protein